MLTIFACCLLAPAANADTSQSGETQNLKEYGNCAAATEVDMFTDAVTHIFICGEETLTDKTVIFIMSRKNMGLAIAVGKGIQLHFEKHIPIAIRVDKGQLIKTGCALGTRV